MKNITVKKFLLALGLFAACTVGYQQVSATITNTSVRTVSALGNGSNQNFVIGFVFQANSQIKVYLVDESTNPHTITEVVFGVGAGKFTISGGNPGTTVVMGTAPSSTQRVVIVRSTPRTQTVDYDETEAFPADDHEAEMDKIVQAVQEQDYTISTKIGLHPGSAASPTPIFPDPDTDTYIRYDSSGNLETRSYAEVLSDIEALKKGNNLSDVTSAATSRSNLGLGTAATQNYDTATFNANKIQGVTVNDSQKADSKILVFRSGPNELGYESVASAMSPLPSGELWIGNASNVAEEQAITGAISLSNTGVTSINAGVIVNADINASAAIADTKLDTIATAGKVSNSATTATASNTAGAIVARDGSGNFSAGTVTAALSGNADTATAPESGTANHVVVLDGSGDFSSEAHLAVSRGGTGLSTLTSGDLLYATGASTLAKLPIGSTGQGLRVSSGGLPEWGQSGGGGLFQPGQNLLVNNSWEQNSSGWTASAGTYDRTTAAASVIPPGVGAATWDASADGDTLTSDATTITSGDGLSGKAMTASCAFKCATGSCTHKIQLWDGTNVLHEQTITSITTGFARTGVTAPAPTSGTVALRVRATANEPELFMDDCYLGLAEGFNISQVSQARVLGSLTWAVTGSCNWTTTQDTFSANFGDDSDCDDNARTATGALSDSSAGVRPEFTITNGPPGHYRVVAEGAFGPDASNTTTDTEAFFRLYDGSTQYGLIKQVRVRGASGIPLSLIPTIEFTFSSTSALGTKTFNLQGHDNGGTNGRARADASSAGLKFTVYHWPLESETAVRSDTMAWRIDANLGGANIDLGNTNNHTYADMSNASLDLVVNTAKGSASAGIACSAPATEVQEVGDTTCTGSEGSESNGITFVAPRAGYVRACNAFAWRPILGSTSQSLEAAFQIVETPVNALTISQEGGDRLSGGLRANAFSTTGYTVIPIRVCGTFYFASSGTKVLRTFWEQDTSSPSSSTVMIARDSGVGQRDSHWTVEYIDQTQPSLTLAGSVNSNSAGNLRVEYAYLTCGTPSSIGDQSGAWVSNIGSISSGDCTVTLVGGIFSSTPRCFTSRDSLQNDRRGVRISASSTTSLTLATFGDGGSADTTSDQAIFCIGPR